MCPTDSPPAMLRIAERINLSSSKVVKGGSVRW
jgi:hypothetical protein